MGGGIYIPLYSPPKAVVPILLGDRDEIEIPRGEGFGDHQEVTNELTGFRVTVESTDGALAGIGHQRGTVFQNGDAVVIDDEANAGNFLGDGFHSSNSFLNV